MPRTLADGRARWQGAHPQTDIAGTEGFGQRGAMPRKIRQLIADLEASGFTPVPGGKGSHRKFRHSRFAGSVILSGKDGEDAQHYQEKQVRNAIRSTTR